MLHSGDPGRILDGPAGGLELAEFAVTRLVEAVVHGLDLADALGRPGSADPTSVNLVSGFLAVDWIRAATGRRPAAELLPASHDWLAADLPLVA